MSEEKMVNEEKVVIETAVIAENSSPEDTEEPTRTEEFTLSGDQVMDKIKALVKEANVRRISLRTEEGKTLFDIPVTIGAPIVAAGFLIPPLGVGLVLGAVAGLFFRVKLVVERVDA